MPLTDREKVLFALARQYISQGRLPDAVPSAVAAGSGTREACSLCGSTIEPDDIEYEFDVGGEVRCFFHLRCHAIWVLATQDRSRGATVDKLPPALAQQ
jgi:hypothetical protein